MKKLERNIPGVYDFDEVLDYLHRGIMDMRTNVVWNLIQMQDTVTLAGQWDGRRVASAAPSGCMRNIFILIQEVTALP